jgi:hypothetical protein
MFSKGIYKLIYLLLLICPLVSCANTDKNVIQNDNVIQNNIETNNQEMNKPNNKLIQSLDELNMPEVYFNDYSLYKVYSEDIKKYGRSEWKITEKVLFLYSNKNIDESLINIDLELYPTPEEARKGMLLTCSSSAMKYKMNADIGIGDIFAWYNEQHLIFSRANVVVGIGVHSKKSMVNIAREIDQRIIDIIK